MAFPTPCIEVCTIVSAPAEPAGTSETTRSRYASRISSPSCFQPDSARGTAAALSTASIRSAIRSSYGGTIWVPSPAPVTARPPRYTL